MTSFITVVRQVRSDNVTAILAQVTKNKYLASSCRYEVTKPAFYLAALFPVFCGKVTGLNVSIQRTCHVKMTDEWPSVGPAFSHRVHFSHRLVCHYDLRHLHVIVLGEEVQELFDVSLTVSGHHGERNWTADAVAVLDE